MLLFVQTNSIILMQKTFLSLILFPPSWRKQGERGANHTLRIPSPRGSAQARATLSEIFVPAASSHRVGYS